MITKRIYKPNEDDIIYHYCDGKAFHSICSNKKIRFSDLFAMNDALEMHWGYAIWIKVANDIINEVGRTFIDEIDKIIHSSGIRGLLVATSFSKNSDTLSQWRAYANDGKGYAIGFSAVDILKLPVSALEVQYDKDEQIKELKEIIKNIYKIESSKKEKFGSAFKTFCFTLSYYLAAYKNPAFVEEQEIRLIHLIDFERSNDFLKLVDKGGKEFGKENEFGEPIQFRVKDEIPVAFIEYDYTNNSQINPIKEVIIGPKNNVLHTSISIFLETIGLGSVKIKKSKASYV